MWIKFDGDLLHTETGSRFYININNCNIYYESVLSHKYDKPYFFEMYDTKEKRDARFDELCALFTGELSNKQCYVCFSREKNKNDLMDKDKIIKYLMQAHDVDEIPEWVTK